LTLGPERIPASVSTPGIRTTPGTVPSLSTDAWRYEHAWRILNLNQELIRATDQKTYTLLVLSTLLVSYSANNLERLSPAGWMHDAALPLLGLTAIAFFVFALATLVARHDATPRTARPSLVFFGHILGRGDLESYLQDFHGATQHEVIDDRNAPRQAPRLSHGVRAAHRR
jgi:hypothetical protein